MERALPTLDQVLQLARDNDWDSLVWKPAYWHELKKLKYAKPRAYWDVFKWGGLTLFWPATTILLVLMPGDGRVFITVYVFFGAIFIWADLHKFWAAWEKFGQIRADQSKLGEIWDRYYEYYGEMLDPTEGNHRRV